MSENKVLKNGNISFADITDPTVGFELDDDENVVVIRNFNQSDTDKLIKSELIRTKDLTEESAYGDIHIGLIYAEYFSVSRITPFIEMLLKDMYPEGIKISDFNWYMYLYLANISVSMNAADTNEERWEIIDSRIGADNLVKIADYVNDKVVGIDMFLRIRELCACIFIENFDHRSDVVERIGEDATKRMAEYYIVSPGIIPTEICGSIFARQGARRKYSIDFRETFCKLMDEGSCAGMMVSKYKAFTLFTGPSPVGEDTNRYINSIIKFIASGYSDNTAIATLRKLTDTTDMVALVDSIVDTLVKEDPSKKTAYAFLAGYNFEIAMNGKDTDDLVPKRFADCTKSKYKYCGYTTWVRRNSDRILTTPVPDFQKVIGADKSQWEEWTKFIDFVARLILKKHGEIQWGSDEYMVGYYDAILKEIVSMEKRVMLSCGLSDGEIDASPLVIPVKALAILAFRNDRYNNLDTLGNIGKTMFAEELRSLMDDRSIKSEETILDDSTLKSLHTGYNKDTIIRMASAYQNHRVINSLNIEEMIHAYGMVFEKFDMTPEPKNLDAAVDMLQMAMKRGADISFLHLRGRVLSAMKNKGIDIDEYLSPYTFGGFIELDTEKYSKMAPPLKDILENIDFRVNRSPVFIEYIARRFPEIIGDDELEPIFYEKIKTLPTRDDRIIMRNTVIRIMIEMELWCNMAFRFTYSVLFPDHRKTPFEIASDIAAIEDLVKYISPGTKYGALTMLLYYKRKLEQETKQSKKK